MPDGLLRVVLTLAVSAVALVVGLRIVVDYLLFHPTAGLAVTPDELGIRADSFHIATDDGIPMGIGQVEADHSKALAVRGKRTLADPQHGLRGVRLSCNILQLGRM